MLVEHADEQRAGDGDEVAGALREGGEADHATAGPGPHPDHRQGQREGAVGEADQQRPGPGAGGRGEVEPGVTGEAEEPEEHGERALAAQPGGDARQQEGERHAHQHDHGQQHARGGGGHPGVAEDLRHPSHGDVRAGGLEAEEDGHRPGGRGAGDRSTGRVPRDARARSRAGPSARGRAAPGTPGTPARTVGLTARTVRLTVRTAGPAIRTVRPAIRTVRPAARTVGLPVRTVAGDGRPGQHREGAERGPHAEPDAPTAAQRLGHGYGRRRGHRGAHSQRHGVDAGHRADPVGEVALDDHRHQDVGDGYSGQCEGARGQEGGRAAGERPQDQARGDGRHARADDGAGPPAAREPGRGEAEEGEAQGGHRGEQPGDAAAHAEAGAYLLEEGAEAGDGGAEVEGGEDEAGDHQRAQPPRAGATGVRRLGYLRHLGYLRRLRCPRSLVAAAGRAGTARHNLFICHWSIIESWDE